MSTSLKAGSYLVERDEGLILANCQTNLVLVLREPSQLFWHLIINQAAHHLGRYEPSSPPLLKSSMTKATLVSAFRMSLTKLSCI